MFHSARPRKGGFTSVLTMVDLIYHSAVRSVRKTHSNAIAALAINILQAVLFVLAFYLIFFVFGAHGARIRGDFLLYIMSGVCLFLTHTKALSAVVGSEGPTNPIMQHAPMNTLVAIASAALASFYIQVLSMAIILLVYHLAIQPIVIDRPLAGFGMLTLAWFSGVALGVVLLAFRPWSPQTIRFLSTFYQRVNVIVSGKMFVANMLPGDLLPMFDWNPLFHSIDQSRGYIFLNYTPRQTDWQYALWVSLALLLVGLMAEFYTRKHASLSWSAWR